MSIFQTVVEIPEYRMKTGYGKNNLFIGSCFTESIGEKMQQLKFTIDLNPFGILYNPVSIANGIRILMSGKHFSESDLINFNGLWHSFFHHSRFSSPRLEKTLREINDRIAFSADFLRKADFLFLTFGTARVFELRETGKIVSNCHKLPSGLFSEYRLTVIEIVELFRDLLSELWDMNHGMKVVFTVSPVRHWKDGAIENQRSKATLLLSVDRLIAGYGDERCAYFPSYEIVMDELRDYRFYADDMIHVSETAVNHIWEKFEKALIDESDRKISDEISKVVKATQHKPFNRGTKEYSDFVNHIIKDIERIEARYPDIDFQEEKNYFCREINIIGGIADRD